MKQLKFFVLAGLAAVLVSGCGTVDIKSVADMQTTRDPFKSALHKEYVALAQSEYDESDIEDAEYFINKAKDAGLGLDLAPQPLSERTIPGYAKKSMVAARKELVDKLWNGADEMTPGPSARAQAMFDCWMQEQEENDQPDHIRACRQAFTSALFDMKVRPKAAAKPMMKKAMPKAKMPPPYVVYFGFDSAEISESEMVKIKQAYADFRLRNPRKLLVAGHTDTSGNKEYNLGLSRYRAAEVANSLMELGVPRSAVQKSRFGEVAPVVETGDGKRAGKNRRVTITFIR
jgi:OOP family OmpA-OmpF porin